MTRLMQLRQRRADPVDEAEGILDAATAAESAMTEEQSARYEAIDKDLDGLAAQIAREEKLAERIRQMEPVDHVNDDTPREAADRGQETASAPAFKSFGDQLAAVYRAAADGVRDPRLIYGATGLEAGVPSEGGFLVQQDFSTELLRLAHENGDLLGRVRKIPISTGSDGIKLPAIDETSRVDGSRWGGVQSYWANEGDTAAASRPKFRAMELSLKKLFGLAYVADELLRDAMALQTVIRDAFVEEMTFKTENAIINGDGAGKPLGILNSGALIVVAKEDGQAANTVVTANILNMWNRMPRRSRRQAVWPINQDIEPQLYTMTLGGDAAAVLLYRPPGVVGPNVGAPFGTLFGRPVIPVEYCAGLGTAGDIILVDPMQYLLIDKEGVRTDSSMHVRFIYDEMTFRFIYRVDGQPAWRKPMTPYKGSNTQSPFVALETRG